MRVLTVVGARPQFVKAAAVSARLREQHEEVLVHTGQHYDDELSALIFEQLALPSPDIELHIGGGTNTSQTARMLAALEPVIAARAPDAVLVYGDTNSTLAGALAAAQAGVPVVHVEAGMRSFDRGMPEEVNRVLTDHISDLLLCPSDTAVENLRREGVAGRIEQIGDVMADIFDLVAPRARARTDLVTAHGVEPGGYALVTAHRPANVDEPARLERLIELLLGLELPAVFPVHPRTRARLEALGRLPELAAAPHLHLAAPLGYLEFTALLCHSRAVLTDSGGVQKEAYLAGVACVTLRDTSEWVETIAAGWNELVDLDAQRAYAALGRTPPAERPPLYGDGHAGERAVAAITLLAQ